MLSIEPEGGIVHVRVFSLNERQPVAVGHLPILASRLAPTVLTETDRGPAPSDAWSAIGAWRQAHVAGMAGAFAVRLAKAVELIWETVTDNPDGNNPLNTYVETAYPERSGSGGFDKITVVTHPFSSVVKGSDV